MLAAAGYELEVCPQLGGAVTALRWQGRDILRPAPATPTDILTTSSFPLIPFANRIAGGRFDWQGRSIDLPVPEDFAPHALHGSGWRSAWTPVRQRVADLVLDLHHPAGAWPWHWSARQRVSLGEGGLEIALSLSNQGETDMPAGLGFHPYFALAGDPRVRFEAESVWLPGGDDIPVAQAAPATIADFSDGRVVDGRRLIDHCYAGWRRAASIVCRAGHVRLTASPAVNHLHLYCPPGEDFACLEPVTHRPDALHGRSGEMPVLRPGETSDIWMRIAIDQMSE
ncbi:aldose 1-epimerase [Maricaulis maris]|uniref:Aldose 1-epimerase n=1 Tax=Maricaulis maris TaxID=74318 RepID=A0A495D3M6_9PROT|nr:aldose 1-epimerase [Maricaulis maris]RKQ96506.1 aldose 1-epimerase [Maricaulis maris]